LANPDEEHRRSLVIDKGLGLAPRIYFYASPPCYDISYSSDRAGAPVMWMKRPEPSKRPLTTASPCIRFADLRRAGVLVKGALTYGTMRFVSPNGITLLHTEYAAMWTDKMSAIELRHRRPDEAKFGSPYRIEIRAARCCCAGGRWSFICPVRETFSPLFCPSGADRFLSATAHNMRWPSDSYSIAQRPVKTAWRLRDRLHAAPAPKAGGYRGGRGAGKKTLARRRAECDAAEIRAMRSLLRHSGHPDYQETA
jgi:hypothetical protein